MAWARVTPLGHAFFFMSTLSIFDFARRNDAWRLVGAPPYPCKVILSVKDKAIFSLYGPLIMDFFKM